MLNGMGDQAVKHEDEGCYDQLTTVFFDFFGE